MSEIIVELMSGETLTFEGFDGYRVLNLQREIVERMGGYSVSIMQKDSDGEFEILDGLDYIENDYYYAIVDNEVLAPMKFFLVFTGDTEDDEEVEERLEVINEDGNKVWSTPSNAVIYVQLSTKGWQFLRRQLRQDVESLMDAATIYLRWVHKRGFYRYRFGEIVVVEE